MHGHVNVKLDNHPPHVERTFTRKASLHSTQWTVWA